MDAKKQHVASQHRHREPHEEFRGWGLATQHSRESCESRAWKWASVAGRENAVSAAVATHSRSSRSGR